MEMTMGLVKFVTFFDDANCTVLKPELLARYDIIACPVSYKYGGKPYFDGINTNSEHFTELSVNHPADISRQTFSPLLQILYSKLSKQGYQTVFVICPHSKFSDCYHEAVLAANRFYRNSSEADDELIIRVIDSKTVGIGTMLHTLKAARSYHNYIYPASILERNVKADARAGKTYIIAENSSSFSREKSLQAFMIQENRILPLDISESTDEVRYDHFADIVCRAIANGGGKYAVSFGCRCSFSANILGRIKIKTKLTPTAVASYGILTTSALGASAFCIHIQ